MEELFRLMETWPDVALERVQRAEKWRAGGLVFDDGAGCLVGHASGITARGLLTMELVPDLDAVSPVSMSYEKSPQWIFDRWALTVGASAAGRECSARAAEILAARRAQKAEVADAVSVG